MRGLFVTDDVRVKDTRDFSQIPRIQRIIE